MLLLPYSFWVLKGTSQGILIIISNMCITNDSVDIGSNDTLLMTPKAQLDITYTVFEVIVGLIAIVGNFMVMTVFLVNKKLRRVPNYYIFSLAAADFFVGLLGVPSAIMSSLGLPKNFVSCLLMLSMLVMICTTSILCLLAVSVDRYWAILWPLKYARIMTPRLSVCEYK